MSKLKFVPLFMLLIILTSCGHNTLTTTEGIGLDATVPVYSYLVGVRMGYFKTTYYMPRGNSNLSIGDGTGTGMFSGSGGLGRTYQLTTGAQLNEGNIKEVLVSKDVDKETKKELAKYLTNTKADPILPSTTRTVSAATAIGEKSPQVDSIKSGMDNIVDKVADVVPKVSKPVAETVQKISGDAKDVSNNAVERVTISFDKLIYAIVIIGLVIVIIGLIYFYIKRKKYENNK